MGGGGFLGLGPAPKAPAAPDYRGAAAETAQGNLEAARAATAANRVNQITPYGNLTYTVAGEDKWGNPMWQAETALNETGQQLLDNQNAASLGLGSTINSALQNVQGTMGQPFQYQGQGINYGTANTPIAQNFGSTAELQGVNAGPAQQGGRGITENLARIGQGPEFSQVGQGPNLQTNVQGGMAGWDRAQNILNQRLQPQLQIQQEQLDSKLRGQGIMAGTEAYNRAKSSLGMQQNDLINQSQLTAQQIGGNLFSQDLQAGQFGNQALNQMNQNQLANTGFNNAAAQQGYGNQLARQQANNAAATQQNQTSNANTQLANQALQANFTNQMAAQGMSNQNAQQGFQNQNFNTASNNQAGQQNFANQQAQAAMQNQAQQQAFNQQMTQYNMPLNTLSALRSGAQVQNPSFVNSSQQATTSGPDMLGATQMGYNAQMGQFNAGQAAQSNFNSGLMGLAGAGIMASDMRLKKNIERIGTLPNGLPFYSFEYIDSFKDDPMAGKGHFTGVMAQDVEKVIPEAVITMANGYKAVNYGMLS